MIYSTIGRAERSKLLRVVKNFWRKIHEKSKIYLKIFPRCARQFVKNFINKKKEIFFSKIMNYFYEILNKLARAAREIFQIYHWFFMSFSSEILNNS